MMKGLPEINKRHRFETHLNLNRDFDGNLVKISTIRSSRRWTSFSVLGFFIPAPPISDGVATTATEVGVAVTLCDSPLFCPLFRSY